MFLGATCPSLASGDSSVLIGGKAFCAQQSECSRNCRGDDFSVVTKVGLSVEYMAHSGDDADIDCELICKLLNARS